MSIQQSEYQSYNIVLTLTNKFLKWVHTHRLLDGPGKFQDELWAKRPPSEQHLFGGKYGAQFKTKEEIASFTEAFDSLLLRHNINESHKHSLLYFIIFLNFDHEEQSLENNMYNHLHDYALFVLDLISDSLAHFERMTKNSIYEKIYDEATKEVFFAKKELVNKMPLKELVEYVPDVKHSDDVIKYLRIDIYDDELYVPEDLIITIQSINGRKLKSLSGEQVSNFVLPNNLLYITFTYMMKRILDDHKRYNTWFYQEIIKDHSTLADFKQLIDKYKKHKISNPKSLAKVGILISDYLIEKNIYSTKRSIALFLFEYFALLKAINLKKTVEFPEDYNQLITFYNKNRIDKETIRNMMKDAGTF